MLKPTIFRDYDIRSVADVEILEQAFGTYLPQRRVLFPAGLGTGSRVEYSAGAGHAIRGRFRGITAAVSRDVEKVVEEAVAAVGVR